MLESTTIWIAAAVAIGVVFAAFAVKTRTVWWIPGALLVAAACLLTVNALTLPPQPFRVVSVLAEFLVACASLLFGLAILHGVSAWRDRRAHRNDDEEFVSPAALPLARVLRAPRRSA